MKTALLSVWDKTGIESFADKLVSEGWRIVASGGTAKVLSEIGLPVTPVSEVTGEPALLGGRVKTLHPAIHSGLLARDTQDDRADLAKRGWSEIDLVVVNLYPFRDIIAQSGFSLETAIEFIDIGGVTLIRAGAKNYARVTVLCDPNDYPNDLSSLEDGDFRLNMARKAFEMVWQYDRAISNFFRDLSQTNPSIELTLFPVSELRYGENPHQHAVLLSSTVGDTPMGGQLLQGKPLSYNNILDVDSSWRAVHLFDEPAVVIVKHVSPCGIATGNSVASALGPAIASDPVSAFGSVITANRMVDSTFVEGLKDLFVECLVAPSFCQGATKTLNERKNLRVLQLPKPVLENEYEMRSVFNGFLHQLVDSGDPENSPPWRVVTERKPTSKEQSLLNFAWKAVQPVRSNAILLASSNGNSFYTVGIGGGQPNRVDCVTIAGKRAGERATGSVLASDAFFPFPDGIEEAARLGVSSIIQPGGSVRDQEVIARANQFGLAMVFTGIRHFRH